MADIPTIHCPCGLSAFVSDIIHDHGLCSTAACSCGVVHAVPIRYSDLPRFTLRDEFDELTPALRDAVIRTPRALEDYTVERPGIWGHHINEDTPLWRIKEFQNG